MTTPTGHSLIGGARIAGTGPSFQSVNPQTAQALPTAYLANTPAQVDDAVAKASAAFPSFVRMPAKARADLLRGIAAGLEGAAADLTAIAHQETALPLPRLQGELARTCGQLRFYGATVEAGWCLDARIDHADLARQPLPKPDVRSMLRGVGPVVVFGSSNFPFAYSVAGGDTASALAAGCPVIVKAHPAHPGTSELVGAVIAAAVAAQGLPGGVFSLLFDAGHGVGTALVRHPGVKAVGFTGSLKGGRVLMDLAAARREPIPVFAEMGSVNPVFILPGAMAARAAELAAGLHASATLGVGQFCTNPGLVVVKQGPEADVFAAELATRMGATAPGVMLTPGIAANYRKGVAVLAGAPGVKTLAQAPALMDGCLAGAAVLTVNADKFIANPALAEEVFGPSTLIIRCRDLDQRRAVAGAIAGQLTATLHGTAEELAAAGDLLTLLEGFAGRVVCNGFPTGVEVCHAMVHGGPYPSSSDGRTTSVGTRAALRFMRPVCFQGMPDALLPDELKESNPLGIPRLVDGTWR